MFDRALFQLMLLQSRAGFRRLWQQVKTPSGAIMTLAMLLLMLGAIGPSVAMGFFVGELQNSSLHSALAHLIPLLLLGISGLGIILEQGKPFLELKPPELQFVLAGPFTDRQILSHRLLTMAIGWIPLTLIFAALMFPYTDTALGTFLGVMWGGAFAILLVIFCTLLAAKVPPIVIRIIRGLFLLALAGLAAEAAMAVFFSGDELSIENISNSIGGNWITSLLLLPFRPFANLMYGAYDLAMLGNLGISMLLVGCVLLACYSLNSGFSELAVEGVERRARKLQRLKSGDVFAVNVTKPTSQRSLAMFPWLSGIGPIAWQQVSTAMRRLGRLIRMVFVVGIVGAVVAVYIRSRYPEAMTEQLRIAAIPIALGAASYVGFLIMMTAQAGFSAPQRHLTNFQLLPIKPMQLAIGMFAGSMVMWASIRIALFLPALVVTSFHPLESLACLFAGFAFDVAVVSAVNLVTATTGLRGMAQGPPDIFQGVRAIVFMLVAMCSVVPTLLIAGLVTFIVGVVIGFSIAGCALTAAIAALLVQPFIWWFTGTVFLRRELPAA